MPEIDVVKENIAYLKFWLGILVVLCISLVGWSLTNSDTATTARIVAAMLSAMATSIAAYWVHKRIEKLILSLRDL